jgi:hypothetical protein
MRWRKSTRCESHACVEVAFRRSSRCDHAHCVEVSVSHRVLVRDSKLGDDSPILSFSPPAWSAFLDHLKT